MSDEKTCTTCNASKPRSEYFNDLTNPDGLKYCCKTCHRKAAKKYRTERDKTKPVPWYIF